MDVLRMIVTLGVFGVLGALVVLVIAKLLKIHLRQLRHARSAEPYIAIEDPSPAAPIIPTVGVTVVGALVVLWCVMHLVVVGYWAVTGYLVPRRMTWISGGTYACVAALISGVGGIKLLRCQRFGRKMIAWGHFLFGAMGFLLFVAALTVPTNPESPEALRGIGYWLASLFGVHVTVDVILGAAAQRVGRPEGWTPEREGGEPEPLPPFGEPLEHRDIL